MITSDKILNTAPANKQVKRIEPNTLGMNKRDYPILVFHNNDQLKWNRNQVVVCYYQGTWGKLRYNHKALHPLAEQEYPHIHQYNLVPSTCHHSDAEESDNRQGKEKGNTRDNSEDDDSPSPIDIFIRRSCLGTPILSHLASPLQRSFMPDNTRVFLVTLSTQAPATPVMATTTTTQTTQQTQTTTPSTSHGMGGQTTGTSRHTPTEVLNQLNIALCCAHPWGEGGSGGGGGGSGGGAGPPPGQPAPAGQGQAAIPAAADIKAMGQLLHKFTRDRTKADEFIEEVKAYFHINEDVVGFNLPIKKVAFTLTLIKGVKASFLFSYHHHPTLQYG